MDITYHYPPELFNILIDTIPLLNKSKKNLILFFRGAGIANSLFTDLQEKVLYDKNNITKYAITRTILTRLNESGEKTLRERREILKRVIEFEQFSSCWDNDILKAKGFISDIQKIINAKDSFTRMTQEKDKERQKYIALKEAKTKKLLKHKENLNKIKNDFFSLFQETDHRKRGKKLEPILNNYFKESNIIIRESFSLKGDSGEGITEQIDGVVEINSQLYLVEMKWWDKNIGVPEISQHLVRIFNRHCTHGIFISSSGYTKPAITTCKESLNRLTIVLCTLEELSTLLEKEKNLKEFFRLKTNAARIEKDPFYKVDYDQC